MHQPVLTRLVQLARGCCIALACILCLSLLLHLARGETLLLCFDNGAFWRDAPVPPSHAVLVADGRRTVVALYPVARQGAAAYAIAVLQTQSPPANADAGTDHRRRRSLPAVHSKRRSDPV